MVLNRNHMGIVHATDAPPLISNSVSEPGAPVWFFSWVGDCSIQVPRNQWIFPRWKVSHQDYTWYHFMCNDRKNILLTLLRNWRENNKEKWLQGTSLPLFLSSPEIWATINCTREILFWFHFCLYYTHAVQNQHFTRQREKQNCTNFSLQSVSFYSLDLMTHIKKWKVK